MAGSEPRPRESLQATSTTLVPTDLVAFPYSAESEEDPYHRVVQSRGEPRLLLVNGRRVETGVLAGK